MCNLAMHGFGEINHKYFNKIKNNIITILFLVW